MAQFLLFAFVASAVIAVTAAEYSVCNGMKCCYTTNGTCSIYARYAYTVSTDDWCLDAPALRWGQGSVAFTSACLARIDNSKCFTQMISSSSAGEGMQKLQAVAVPGPVLEYAIRLPDESLLCTTIRGTCTTPTFRVTLRNITECGPAPLMTWSMSTLSISACMASTNTTGPFHQSLATVNGFMQDAVTVCQI